MVGTQLYFAPGHCRNGSVSRRWVCSFGALLLGLFGAVSVHAGDTLRHYKPSIRPVYYTSGAINGVAERFALSRPVSITSVTVHFHSRVKAGRARVRVVGWEGGLGAPLAGRDVIQPREITLRGGYERSTITFERPLRIEEPAFFVVVDQLDSGVVVLSDKQTRAPICSDGATVLTRQMLKQGEKGWDWGRYAFLIDVVVTAEPPLSEPGFGDVTAALGLDSVRAIDHGISWGDYNRDGFPDLYVGSRLYLNREGRRFEDVSHLLDRFGSARAGVFLDADRDGALDLLLVGIDGDSTTTCALGRSVNDGERFIWTPLAIPGVRWPTTIAIADPDRDGYPDVLVGQSAIAHDDTLAPDTLPTLLLHNDRGVAFSADPRWSLPSAVSSAGCVAAEWADLDGDGDLDLFLATERAVVSQTGAIRGGVVLVVDSGRFNDLLPILGAGTGSAHVTGAGWGDLDGNGVLDLFLSERSFSTDTARLRSSMLLFGQGGQRVGEWRGVTADIALSWHAAQAGVAVADYNNDGRLDAFLSTDCACIPSLLLDGDSARTFRNSSYRSGLFNRSLGPDITWVDIDRDGLLDLAGWEGERFRVLRNQLPREGRWITVGLDPREGLPTGSDVQVYTDRGMVQRRVVSGRGRLMQEPDELHFGLGDAARVDSIVVRWRGAVDGKQTVAGDGVDRSYTVASHPQALRPVVAEASVTVVPNPTSGQTTFTITIEEGGPVHLELIDGSGRTVATLRHARLGAGRHPILWDGRGDDGLPVPNGGYHWVASVGARRIAGRLVIQR